MASREEEKATPSSQGSAEEWLKEAAKAPAQTLLDSPDPGTVETLEAPSSSVLSPVSSFAKERYQRHGEVARGGLGRILRAHDQKLKRPVALKELLRKGPQLEERFLREALLTARLEHPSIVPIHDLGLNEEGALYYAMKLIDGRSFDQVVSEKKTVAERLSLLPHVLDACQAIAYAHSSGIIHRDLKPQNILVGSFGETVVVDWGLAKELKGEGAKTSTPPKEAAAPEPYRAQEEEASLTRDGAVMGTPAYMPVEQAQGKVVDERADVYSLGAILYYLLSGQPPYTAKSGREILFKLLEEPPVPLQKRQPEAPKDLLAIVQKAMAREAKDRYPTAKELAQDLKSFQTGQIVGAYQYSSFELFRRWVRRHWAPVLAASLALVITGAVILWDRQVLSGALKETEKQKDEAEEREQEAIRALDEVLLEQARLSVDKDPKHAISLLSRLSPDFTKMSAARVIAADALSRRVPSFYRGHKAPLDHLAISPDGKLLASASRDKTVRLWDLSCDPNETRCEGKVILTYEGNFSSINFSPNGELLAIAGSTDTIYLFEVKTGKTRTLQGYTSPISRAPFSPDSTKLAVMLLNGTIQIWDIAKGEGKTLTGQSGGGAIGAFSPDSVYFASADLVEQTVRLWDVNTGEARPPFPNCIPTVPQFSPDGKYLALAGLDQTIRLFTSWQGEDRQEQRLVVPGGTDRLVVFRFSPDGAHLISSAKEPLAVLWSLNDLGSPRILPLKGVASALSFSPDSQRIAVGQEDGAVRLFGVNESLQEDLVGAVERIRVLLFSPDGASLFAVSQDELIRRWSLSLKEDHILASAPGSASGVSFSKDGAKLAFNIDNVVYLQDTKTGEQKLLRGHKGSVFTVELSPDGSRLASCSKDHEVYLWDTASGLGKALTGHTNAVRAIAFSPDGGWLASGGRDNTVRLWAVRRDSLDATLVKTLEGHTDLIRHLAFSPDGARLASASFDRTVRLWNVLTGALERTIEAKGLVLGVSFSKDRTRLAYCGLLEAALVDLSSGEKKTLPGYELQYYGNIEFSPDGTLLAATGETGHIYLWDSATGETRKILTGGHVSAALGVRFSPDGFTLASFGADSYLRLWDLSTGEGRTLKGHQRNLSAVDFSPDSKTIVSASADGTIRRWKDDLPHEPNELRAKLKELASSQKEK